MVVVIIQLGFMNLILSTIVECAAEAREKNLSDNARQRDKEQHEIKLSLLEHCEDIDKDHTGTLTLTEILEAYQESQDFRDLLKTMGISGGYLEHIFSILDTDGSGSLEYK